jgi:hypothetical protein
MSETKRLTKADVLRAHIDSAIILTAYEDAYVSAHTLVMACEELIRTLSDKKGRPYSSDWRSRVNPKYRPKGHTYINDKYNFFKHADRDIDDVLEVNPEDVREFNATFLASFITGYSTLFSDVSLNARTFYKWAAVCGWAVHLDALPHADIIKKAIAYLDLDTPKRERDLLRQWLGIPIDTNVLPKDESDALYDILNVLFVRNPKT